jgi:NADH-quinone oxidoreductase subunit M
MSILLPILVLLPAIGAGGLVLFRSEPRRAVRWAGWIAGFTFVLSLILATRFHAQPPIGTAAIQPCLSWKSSPIPVPFLPSPSPSVQLELGLDGPGIGMILLTSAVVFAVMLIVPRQISHRSVEYTACLLLVESALLGAFVSMDILLFYIFFEATLLPILALMIGWGNHLARTAAMKFLLFTLAGSLPMLAGLIALAILSSPSTADITISIPEIANRLHPNTGDTLMSPIAGDPTAQSWIFALILLGLGIKMAILPLHTWLPATYLAAHPTTTAILAAVVLKLGLFGMLRILLPILPIASHAFGEFWGPALGAIAVVYGSLVALAQRDLRLLLAYGSLGHVGFITMGLFSLNQQGIAGATIQMVNHGITTAAMFLLLAMLSIRRRSFEAFSRPTGIANRYPMLTLLFIFFTLAGAGMPGLNNFVGEVLAMSGLIERSLFWTAFASLGMIIGAWYALRLIERLLFGPPDETTLQSGTMSKDLRRTELAALLPLALVCLWIGIFPQRSIQTISRDTDRIARLYAPAEQTPLALAAGVDAAKPHMTHQGGK